MIEVAMACRLARAGALLAVLLGMASCQGLRPEPFSAFGAALRELRRGTDRALEIEDEWARERFAAQILGAWERVAAASRDEGPPDPADRALLEGLLLETDARDPFAARVPEDQLHLRVWRFREGVYRLNSVFVAYAELLTRLAAPDLVPSAPFAELTRELDAGAAAALEALGVGAPAGARGALSFAVAEGARLGIEAGRRARLRDTVLRNQAVVEAHAEHGRRAVALAARRLRQEYEVLGAALLDELPAASAARRRARVRDVVDLNAAYVRELAILRSLAAAYARLPAAHRELGGDGSAAGGDALRALVEEARRLDSLARRAPE